MVDSTLAQGRAWGKETKIDIQELMKKLDLKHSEINDVLLGKEEMNTMK